MDLLHAKLEKIDKLLNMENQVRTQYDLPKLVVPTFYPLDKLNENGNLRFITSMIDKEYRHCANRLDNPTLYLVQ